MADKTQLTVFAEIFNKIWKDIFKVNKLTYLFIVGLIITPLIIFGIDYVSGKYYFNRVNNKIDVLERIGDNIIGEPINKKINKEYSDIVYEISEYKTRRELRVKDSLVNVLFALIIPFFVLAENIREKNNQIKGTIIIGMMFGIAAFFIPKLGEMWVNGLVIFIGEIIIVLGLFEVVERVKME